MNGRMITVLVTLGACGALSAQPVGHLELRIVSPMPAYAEGPVVVDPADIGGMYERDFLVQGRVVEDPTASGITSLAGVVTCSDESVVVEAVLTAEEAFDLEPGEMPGVLDPLGRRGLFPTYRQACGFDCVDPNPSDGLHFVPLDLDEDGNGEGVNGVWADLFKFTWRTSSDEARTVTITASGSAGAYQALPLGLQQPTAVDPGELSITIGQPGITPDYNNDGRINLLDLLDLLEFWLIGDADINNDGRTSALDLIQFLAVWLPAHR